MPDFSSNISLIPEDNIAPAIGNLTENLLKAESIKRAEDERRMQKLTELATFAMGDMDLADKAAIDKEKSKFLTDVVPKYRDHNGYLPFDVQADFNARKQNISYMISKAEQDKKDMLDLSKKMATDDKINREKTAENMKSWLATPIMQRGSVYDAVRLNFDYNDYLNKHIVVKPSHSESPDPKNPNRKLDSDIYTTEQVVSQMKQLFNDDPTFQRATIDQMRDAGYQPQTMADVERYWRDNKYPDKFTVDKRGYTDYKGTTINNYGNGAGGVTPDMEPGKRNLTSSVWGVKDGSYSLSTEGGYSVYNEEPVTFKANNAFQLNNYNGTYNASTSIPMKVNKVESLPVVWIKKGNKPGYWELAPDEWVEKNPEYKDKVEHKWYIIGQQAVPVKKADGMTETTYREYAVPATSENVSKLNTNLKKNGIPAANITSSFNDPAATTKIGSKQSKYSFSQNTMIKTPNGTFSVSQILSNPNNTNEMITTLLGNGTFSIVK